MTLLLGYITDCVAQNLNANWQFSKQFHVSAVQVSITLQTKSILIEE